MGTFSYHGQTKYSAPHYHQRRPDPPPGHLWNHTMPPQGIGLLMPYYAPPRSSFDMSPIARHLQSEAESQCSVVFNPTAIQRKPATALQSYAACQTITEQLCVETLRPLSLPSSQRGPPRKPKRSGWAIWVGNLPMFATVEQLKDHFSANATQDIQSVFLISKTSCAFINYKTEKACLDAIERFNATSFLGNRLVCRVRNDLRTPEAGSPSPTTSQFASQVGLTSSSKASLSSTEPSIPRREEKLPVIAQGDGLYKRPESVERPECSGHTLVNHIDQNREDPSIALPKLKERFFILKSLTLQDLQVSTRDKTWMTQPHNEKILNEAFFLADNVYLIFSANKSGHYFGYARMVSSIPHDGSPDSGTCPSSTFFKQSKSAANISDELRIIITPATATAPKGRITDDSARGTIFWEAEPDIERGAVAEQIFSTNDAGSKSGKKFALQWIVTNQVPFCATRGIRNAFNFNKEVKIARDGQEVDPRAGRQLLHLFNEQTSR